MQKAFTKFRKKIINLITVHRYELDITAKR